MGRDMDPYRLLGVSPGCTLEEVKQAYRTKARKPILISAATPVAFIEVSEAYKQVLDELAQRPASRGRHPPTHHRTRDSSVTTTTAEPDRITVCTAGSRSEPGTQAC